jgi:general secretion pathway protein E
MKSKARYLGEIVLERGLVNEDQLIKALEVQKEKGTRLGGILKQMGLLTEEQLLEILSEQLNLPYESHLERRDIDTALVEHIPIGYAKQYEVLPLSQSDSTILVAISDPLNFYPLDDLRRIFGLEVKPLLASSESILTAINRVYDRASRTAEGVIGDLEGEKEDLSLIAQELEEPEDLLDSADEAPIIRLVNSLLLQAVKERASDIHIEPFEKDLAVRFRIDGVLYEVIRPPKRFQSSISSRVKIMGGLNIAEKRLPQDGRIRIKLAGRDIDIRLSTLPTAFGERIVMRLLDRDTVMLDLEGLGFSSDKLSVFNDLIHHSHGIILVTGPTGSGKTTTLYAALQKVNSPELNIITIEDPIEYQIPGIGQIQVNPKINLTFAGGLRSIVRQDPDVILVGEIRDAETAEIAIQASLTGHLVFSTLHTNDSAGALTRMIEMGIEPFLISSSLIAVLAQRLVRVLCPDCRKEEVPEPEILKMFGFSEKDKGLTFYRPEGCPKCLNTGFVGRTAIFEMLLIDDEIREMINRRADSNEIKRRAREKGMLTLREDAAQKVRGGITSISEVVRVTQEDLV